MNPHQFLEYFVSVSVQVALIVAVTHWVCRLAGSERTTCRLWMGCFVTILIAAASGMAFPHFRFAHPWSGFPTEAAANLVRWQSGAGRVVVGVWMFGATIAILLFAWQLFKSHSFIQSCMPIRLDELVDEQTAAELEAKSPLRIFVSSVSTSPFCWQMHSPCIVLPESILSMAPRELALIIKHETEHLCTGHPLHLFLQRLAEAIFWYHPMVWWASHQVALAREFACDDAAVESPNEIADYLRTLLKVVERGTDDNEGYHAPLAFGRGQSLIARRARRLVEIAQRGHAPKRAWKTTISWGLSITTSAIVLAVFWLPVNVLASPRSSWSPWPSWSANVLHDFGIQAPDYEPFDARSQLFELEEHKRDRHAE